MSASSMNSSIVVALGAFSPAPLTRKSTDRSRMVISFFCRCRLIFIENIRSSRSLYQCRPDNPRAAGDDTAFSGLPFTPHCPPQIFIFTPLFNFQGHIHRPCISPQIGGRPPVSACLHRSECPHTPTTLTSSPEEGFSKTIRPFTSGT